MLSLFIYIVPTDLRSDMVWWEDNARILYVVEMIVCYDTNSGETAERKMAKYINFFNQARERD